MNRIKMFVAKKFFKELLPPVAEKDASGNTGGGAGRELASEFVKKVTYKENGDTDFEDPDFDLEDIQNGYNTDSYIRQGVDKYVDQIFKEGYNFFGTDSNAVDYLKLRLAYIAEASNTPTNQLLMDIAEDVVKYGNCMIVKARNSDPNALPQGTTVTGLYGKDPVVGYFCANPVTMKCKRDEFGTVTEWQQDNDGGTQTFAPEDVVHFYYKREKGNAYGTSFLIPVLDDVRALRQAEENVLKMMYRNIYPFYHVAVGTEDATGTSSEVEQLKQAIDGMDVEGGLVTTERVQIKPIASDKVIDAEPYLRYMESRVFSGMGIPEIMFGRGNCYDEKTQTLTDHGWKFWFEVSSNDKIATYNPDTGNIEYHKPNDDLMKYVSHYKGQMVHFQSKHIDIKVSPQHDMWVCTNGRKAGKMKWKKMKAIDLYNSGIQNFYFMEQTNGINDIPEEPYITIPYVESRYTNGNNNIITFDTKTFVEFLGYFISEGSLNPSKEGKYCISISQKKKHVLDKIISCIDKLNIKYNTRDDSRDGTVEITIYHKSLWMYLKDNFGLYDKDRYISRTILDLSPSSLKILLNALIDGDGTRDNRTGRSSMSYYSISENLIDNVQEICVKLGYKAKILYGKPEHGNVHRVMISDSCSNYRYCTRDMITLEDYDGIMYCYNVPNHLFITRRNGKVAIQGNTANRSTGDNMTSEMADRIRAISRVIEMFFNSFIIKEILMEGGYDPVLNPDQAVEFKFNDNDVDVMIKKEVHAIYKYEHNAITEDEMRDELGMDPIPDGEREKMFVELITRENIRLEADLNLQAQKEAAKQQGTAETNNKQKNQGGKSSGGSGNKKSSSSKNSIEPKTIGLIKDSIDNLENSIDNYIKECFASNTQILQSKLSEKVVACNKEIMYTISRGSEIAIDIQQAIVGLSTRLINQIHTDMIGTNTFSTTEASVIDIIDVRINIYRDSLIKYIQNYKSMQTQLIERGS